MPVSAAANQSSLRQAWLPCYQPPQARGAASSRQESGSFSSKDWWHLSWAPWPEAMEKTIVTLISQSEKGRLCRLATCPGTGPCSPSCPIPSSKSQSSKS